LIAVFVLIRGSSEDVDPPEPLLPFGHARVPQIWVDNDDDRDAYLSAISMAAAAKGKVILHGSSRVTSTDADGYNPHVSDADAEGFGAGGLEEWTAAIASGFPESLVPPPMKVFKGRLVKPESGRIEDTVPIHVPAASAIVSVVRGSASPENPLIVCCGGQLTTVADAYLQDPEIADRIVVCFIGGRPDGSPNYNEWADGWATEIVMTKLKVVIFPVEPVMSAVCPLVPKARLASDLPTSPFTKRLIAKMHPTHNLPGDHDADGGVVVCVLNQGYATAVQRKSVTGGTNYDGHIVPVLANHPNGNIWMITAVNQPLGTATWWETMADPVVWQEGEELTFNEVFADDFNRPDEDTLDGVDGWAKVGELARKAIVNGKAVAPMEAGFDKRTEDYGPDHYAQITWVDPQGKDEGIGIRITETDGHPTGYRLLARGPEDMVLQRLADHGPVDLLSGLVRPAPGDALRIAAKDDRISLWKRPANAGTWKLVASVRDTIHAAGAPALASSGVDARVDDWASGHVEVKSVLTARSIWRKQFFNEAELLDSSLSGDAADPDGDGLANSTEYAFGFDPRSPSQNALPKPKVENGALRIAFQAPRLDINYVVEASVDLERWDAEHLILTKDGTRLSAIHEPPDADKGFMRVRVVTK
jgi:inosine-uridine nucleoside N-ribohydrolase